MLLKQWLESVDYAQVQYVLQQYMQDVLTANLPVHSLSAGHLGSFEFEEYHLIQILEKQGLFQELEKVPASLALFAKHFLTRRSLYQSQAFWRAEGYCIEFGLMRIKLAFSGLPIIDGHKTEPSQVIALLGEQAIADFYGDINVLKEATQESVNELLSDFWQRYDAFLNADNAYAVLNIKPDAAWVDIQKAYRKLAAQHHPDKGGDAKAFTRIKNAYDQIKKLRRS